MTRASAQTMMQYPIDLPTDYDMGIIRERVRSRGNALDDRAGLLCKAYCIREHGVYGSRHNQYAPFYVWDDAAAAGEFLWSGGGFEGIVRDFARPRLLTWLPVTVAGGTAHREAVSRARLERIVVPRDANLIEVASELTARARKYAEQPGVHLACAGIDPTRWEAVVFTTGADDAPGTEPRGAVMPSAVVEFRVLHISQPGAA